MSDPVDNVDAGMESARQSAELAALARMIHLSRGAFSLSIAVCNSVPLRDYLIRRVRQMHPDVSIAVVPPGTVDVYGAVTSQTGGAAPTALFVTGLQDSVRSDAPTRPALKSLNASRELWQSHYACPVVFWLPEYAAQLLSFEAPDFWRYRSHRFEFVSDQAGALEGLSDSRAGDISTAALLSEEEKQFRIAELEQRLAELGSIPPPSLAAHATVWLAELAYLYQFVGQLDDAERMYRESLAINQRLGDQEGMAADYGSLGVIYQMRGDLEAAEQMHRQALVIAEKLRDQQGMAANYGNLGLIHRTRGDLDAAEQMLRKALAICEALGHQEGIAIQYGNLGLIYRTRGEVDAAEEMYRKALAINEKLGRLDGMANQYGNLATIYQMRGDLDAAERTHHKALAIAEKSGNQRVIATVYGNLGVVYRRRGNLDAAEQMLAKSLAIHEKLGRTQDIAGLHANLGLLYAARGDLKAAEHMLRKALAIHEDFGNQQDMAIDYANLGIIQKQRGNFAAAHELWTKARELYARLGARHRADEVQGWLDAPTAEHSPN